MDVCFQFPWVCNWEWNCWVLWKRRICLLGNCQTALQERLHHFTFSWGVLGGLLEKTPRGPAAPTLPSWNVTCFWPERQKRVWGAPLQGLWLTSVGPAQCFSLFLLGGKSGRALIGRDHVRVGALGFHSGLLPLTFCVTWDESGDLSEPPFDRPVAGRAVRGHVHPSLAVCQPGGTAHMLGVAAI